MAHYTEDDLVQKTTADYLQSQLGWESVYAYNTEGLGPQSALGRHSEKEIILTRYLREALIKLNPDLPDAAYDDAVRQMVTTMAGQNMLAINREKYELIINGIQVTFRNAQGERVRERLKVIDFNDPENNHFLCVRELWIKGDLYRRRADIIGFVNGIPLLFMELKNISKDIRAAYEQNFMDYKDTVPHLFYHNAIVILANGIQAKLGTLSSKFEHFNEWKRLEEDECGNVEMETLLKGVCHKRNFIDLIENFILFDESTGDVRKILARNHQFLGVNKALEAVRDRKNRMGKLGIFWHTQGAGKSYSIVFFTRKVHRKLGANFTFLILTDREDLDNQIYKTYAGCNLANNDKNPCRATSGGHLSELLHEHKAYIFSLIQKFNQDVDPSNPYTNRDDLIVVTDEAHRTQYGTLALNLRNALPQASYIGFTGTPLFSHDEITRRVFGEYISTYDFQRAVEDKATLPLYYDARGEKLGIVVHDLNERIASKIEELELEDINIEQRLEKELKRDYHIITAEKRLHQIAEDFVMHYTKSWEMGKVMFVCIDKVTCVRMYNLIQHYWSKYTAELEKQARVPKVRQSEQEDIYLQRKIMWMKETVAAVVVSEEQGEVAKFDKWGLDITPHRRLMKEGIALPEAMRQKPQFANFQRMGLEEAFKEQEHPFRIAIVCAMWLTGFDVPCLSTLYLDKPLKAHTLMQAVARANRVHEGKNNGLIVDYCGILKNLRKALCTFAGRDGDNSTQDGSEIIPVKPEEELLIDLQEAIQFVRKFLEQGNASLEEITSSTGFQRNAALLAAKEAANVNDQTRKCFEVMCREVFKKFKSCINSKSVNQYRADYEAINAIYKSLIADREQADISSIILGLHEIVDGAIAVDHSQVGRDSKPYDISKVDFDILRQDFEKSPQRCTTVQNLKEAIEKRVTRLLMQNPLRTDFQQHYECIIAEYNREKDRVTVEKTFEELIKFVTILSEEEKRAVEEGLTEESLAIFDLLKKNTLQKSEIKKIKDVATELLAELKEEKLKVDHWRDKEATRDAVKNAIRDFLWDERTGLPVDLYDEDEVGQKSEEVFGHIYRVYPTVPSPYYGVGI